MDQHQNLFQFQALLEQNSERLNKKYIDISLLKDLGWYDWDCADEDLPKRTIGIAPLVFRLIDSKLVNPKETFVALTERKCVVSIFFCSIETEKLLYWIDIDINSLGAISRVQYLNRIKELQKFLDNQEYEGIGVSKKVMK